MLAMVERLEDCTGSGLDSTRDFHEYIEGMAGRQHRWVVSQHWESTGNCRFRLPSRPCTAPLHDASFPECPFPMFRGPIRDRHEANAGCWCCKLQSDGAARRTSSNHSDTDRMTRGLTLSKGSVYIHGHLPRSTSGQLQP